MGYMATADDLMASAERFYQLAGIATNVATKLQLVNLGNDYFRQANELRHDEKRTVEERWPQNQLVQPPL